MGKLRGLFLIIFASVLAINVWAALKFDPPKDADILSVMPGAASFKHIKAPIDCYRVFDADGNSIGVAVVTTEVPPVLPGYRDEIAVLVGVGETGTITGTTLLAHREDQKHIDTILSNGFLLRFTGHKADGRWSDIETVTGATISSEAMKEDIRTAASAVLEKVIKSGILSTKVKKTPGPTAFRIERVFSWANLAALGLIVLSVASVLLPKRRLLRSSTLLLSFLFIGFIFNTPVTIGNFIDVGYGLVPGLNNLALLLLLIFAVVSALVKGPLYCSYLCPFGAMQDGASGVRLPKIEAGKRFLHYARYFRWLALFAVVVAVAGFGFAAARNFEPFSLCFARDAGSAVWVQSGVILVAALFFRRPWCRLFCPTGLIIETLSKLGVKIRCRIRTSCSSS